MFHKTIIFTSIAILAFPNVYAQQSTGPQSDYYQESGFRLTSNPVICMNTPSDPTLTTKMQGYTVAAAEEWSNLLNVGGTSRIPVWSIQLIPGTSAICNITVDYTAQPSQSDTQASVNDAVGVTYWNINDHTAHIVIFYDDLLVNTSGSFYYADSLAPDYQMQWALKHELGHAFGLGHYIITSAEENAKWLNGFEPVPSIMLPNIPDPSIDGDSGIFQATVTQMDITHLKSLYNNNGFGGYTSTTSQAMQTPTAVQNITISADKQVYYYGDHMTITINVSQVTGGNATLTLATSGSQTKNVTIPIVISELQTSITSPDAINETNSVLGTVEAILSYDGQTTSTSFQIAGQLPSNVTSQEQTNSILQPIINSTQPAAPTSTAPTISEQPSTLFVRDKFNIKTDIEQHLDARYHIIYMIDEFNNNNLTSIQLPADEFDSNSKMIAPSWFWNDIIWWSNSTISDTDFASAMQYLYNNGLFYFS
jgi:hypothetical protein